MDSFCILYKQIIINYIYFMKSQEKNTEPIKILFCSLPLAGHYNTMKNIIEILSQDEKFHVTFATSEYQQEKIKFQAKRLKRLNLKDNVIPEIEWIRLPFYYYENEWYDQLEHYVLNEKPSVLVCDFFATALMKIGRKYDITTVINLGVDLQLITIFDLPLLRNNFSFLGISVLYHNFYKIMLPTMMKQLHQLGVFYDKCLVLVSSVFGLTQPLSLPPNIKLIGSTKNFKQEAPNFDKDLAQWIERARSLKKDIIYITFGSLAVVNKKFIDYLYEGLKKIDILVIWSMRQGEIPQKNQKFFVKKWLPQEDILNLSQVKIVLTHAGWGGIIQCIQAKKPMLCVPIFADQPHNADLVVKRGLGLILRKKKVFQIKVIPELIQPNFTHQWLSSKIKILKNEPSFIVNLTKMSNLLAEAGGAEQGARLIKNAAKNGIYHLIDKDIDKVRKRSILPFVLLSLALFGTAIYKSRILKSLTDEL